MSKINVSVLGYIDEIINEFDFNRVHDTMKALNWTWIGSKESPTIEEMIKQSRRLLKVSFEEETTVSTGGFEATYNNGVLGLKFVVSQWEEEIG